MTRPFRTLICAFLAGPVGGAIFGVVSGLMLFIANRWGDMMVPAITGSTLVGLFVGAPAMLTLGLGAHHLLLARGWLDGWQYTLAGAAGGVVLALGVGQSGLLSVFNSDLPPGAPTPSNFEDALAHSPAAAMFGASCAYAFWRFRRPDRDEPNPGTAAP